MNRALVATLLLPYQTQKHPFSQLVFAAAVCVAVNSMAPIHPWHPKSSTLPVLLWLLEGGCVVLPTESTYEVIASALRPDAVARLHGFSHGENVPAVVVADEAQVREWMPLLRGVGPRLYRKLGPGPLIVRAHGGYVHGHWACLSESARRFLAPDGLLALRWPAHPLWADLRGADIPIISVVLPTIHSAEDAARQLVERVDLIVDAGATEFGSPPSIVTMNGRGYTLEREGALTADLIGELALCRILFVCTGNTCRSPMAEALCAKLLADQLGCAAADLKQHGFCVQSAGLGAMMGNEASPEAITVTAQTGADLAAHRSRPVTMELLAWADHVFAMTASHWQALAGVPAAQMVRPRLLSPAGDDVSDPIGGPLADYQACAEQILACLQRRLPELLES